ncbi:BREX-3 system phosphatase PglZ [Sphingobium yanoikuyae]|uniref:BREX-3 system phosphatase PglZ n=1 Tax=Sphingobium yanoikuyae TaxID=13690 RepID=UPI002FDCC5CE
MSAWSDHITAPFQPEFAALWIVSDPDEILLTPSVADVLLERGIETVTYRDPLAFRLFYETRILQHDNDGRFIVRISGDAGQIIPWDVLHAARREAVSIPELFSDMDAATVRAIGPDRYDDLWQIVSSRAGMSRMGPSATRDFVAANIYRVVPDLLRRPSDIWEQAFDVFFRGVPLPPLIARHVATKACRPDGMTVDDAAAILSDRATFIDRVQRDWDRFARSVSQGDEPEADVIPFTLAGIRINLDSMVLDGTIAPTKVDAIPQSVPAWMQIGMVRDEQSARQLAAKRIERLRDDVPPAGSGHGTWLHFAERYSEVVEDLRTSASSVDETPDALTELGPIIDDAFFTFLASSFDGLGSNSFATAPSIVHQIAPHMAHRRNLGERRQALVVVDGLALDQWYMLERRLRRDRPDLLIDSRSCFAWIPTVTGVSRQAIFAGDQPRSFAKTLGSTSAEPNLWKRFWSNEGLPDKHVVYARGLGAKGSSDAALSDAVADGVEVIGVVVDTVDEMMHGELFGKKSLTSRIEHWLDFGEWTRLVSLLIDGGYRIYLTADHGNVDVVGMGRPSEGVAAEERGERSRIYDSDALRQKAAVSIDGSRLLQPGGLPETYKPLFAPTGKGFISNGRQAVVHGGTSIEEVIVPFVRISRKENS